MKIVRKGLGINKTGSEKMYFKNTFLLGICFIGVFILSQSRAGGQSQFVVWQIGDNDNQSKDMALYPDVFEKFLEYDFGYEARCFLMGSSGSQTEFPFVLSGQGNDWGGTGRTSGIRSPFIPLSFELQDVPPSGFSVNLSSGEGGSSDSVWGLSLGLLGVYPGNGAVLKLLVNDKPYVFTLEKGKGNANPVESFTKKSAQIVGVTLPNDLIKEEYNELVNTSLEGRWVAFDEAKLDFDPFKLDANKHYVEGNAWQLTFFALQDVNGLADFIGRDKFIDRLEWGFEENYKWRYNEPNDQYWNYPVVQGNQQSMHFVYLLNWVGKLWRTQKWSRAVMERYYGSGVSNAYLGDEDQGQMIVWYLMDAIGLFQIEGGTRVEPFYEIESPSLKKITLDLGGRFNRGEKFTIEAKNTNRTNMYVQSVQLNGKPLQDFKLPASELLKGESLILEMGPEPNKNWSVVREETIMTGKEV